MACKKQHGGFHGNNSGKWDRLLREKQLNTPTEVGTSGNPRHRIRWVVCAALATAVLVAVLAVVYARTHAVQTLPVQPAEDLSIALSTTPHAALLYIAADKGFFADEGLRVTIIPVSHGKAAMDLLAQGKTDLAAAAEVPFVISVLKGEDLAIATTVVNVASEMAVISRRDRGIAAPRDLVGKKVGVTFGTSGEYFFWAFLIRHRIAPEQVTLVDVPPGQIVEALANGSIDAASTWEPLRGKATEALAGNGVVFTEANAYTVTHAVIGRNDFLKTRRTAIEKLIRAMIKAEHFNQKEPQRAQALVSARLKIDAKSLEAGWSDLDFSVDLRQSHLITLEDEARWAMARGYAAKAAIPNFLPHLYMDALLAVRPDRVTVAR